MNRAARYGTALLVAGVVTGITSLTDPSTEILTGIFGLYAVTTEIVIRYPEVVSSRKTRGLPSGVFGGGATLGALMLSQGYGPEIQFGAGMLGLGLALFGVSTGYWLAESSDPDPAI
ncbi:hypothetical protein [Halohasta litorea]|uniref:Uncharacterized protein n=1 Tax=Halohasta litorea TaxID=869891 RepID=A0ABD6D8G3_9EURY|nr:hypothetical protein [Halohasta litorea]